jgi:hypothetical protein
MGFARAAASHFGVRHLEHYLRPEDVIADLPAIVSAFDAPFGPTVLELASAVPAGGGKTLLDVFLAGLGLPNRAAFDAFLTPAQKNTALGALVNGQIQPLGYTPVGLQDSGLATTNIVGGPVATFTYGWTSSKSPPEGAGSPSPPSEFPPTPGPRSGFRCCFANRRWSSSSPSKPSAHR